MIAEVFHDPPILIVLSVFVFAVIYTLISYIKVGRNLKTFNSFISRYKKSDLNFRFSEIDNWMSANPYTSTLWLEFKNTLVFSESVALKGEDNQLTYKEVSSTVQNIQTTVDPGYFFNADTLALNHYNARLIATFPTILTGFGPLFTFMNIAIAFGKIDFSTQTETINSVSSLMASMQLAALVSVVAVGASLIFLMFENCAFALICRKKISNAENYMGKLFDNITSEKFLLELLKETKIQNNSIFNLLSTLPNNFQLALNAGITSNLVPYLENLIFGVNHMNKQLKDMAKQKDDVDDLFNG